MSDSSTKLEKLITAAKKGDRVTAQQLIPLVYDELRSLAGALLKQLPPGQTLQATSLVHEAYAKLVRSCDPGWDGRGHFFAAAAQAMREIIVDHARRKGAIKRGGDRRRLNILDSQITFDAPSDDILALHEVIARLEKEDPRKSRIVLLRFFSGLSMEQIAEQLGVSRATVDRDWRFARAWLARELERADTSR